MVAMPGTTWTRGEIPVFVSRRAPLARRRHRPGHDEQSLHPVRPRRPTGRQPSARASPDHAAARLGRARPGRDHRAGADVRPGRPARGRRRCHGARRRRHQQPARDDRRVGSTDGSTGPSRDRLAGHADGRCRGRHRRPGPVPGQDRAAGVDLLERPEAALDPRPGRSRAVGAGVRDDRYVGALAAHRRTRRRRPRDRCHERQPDDADGPRDARMGRVDPRGARHPALRAPRDPWLVRGVRHGRRRTRGCADRRHPRRPARGAVRPDVLRGRPGEVHVRHRRVHADAHGQRRRCTARTG